MGLGKIALVFLGFNRRSHAILSPVNLWRSYITPVDYIIPKFITPAASQTRDKSQV
jgi:hypothetical protein